jgi:amino acid transporter
MNEQNLSLKSFMLTTCMAMGFMISPLSLVILGNGAGLMGTLLLWTLPFIAMISFWTAYSYRRLIHPKGFSHPEIPVKDDSKRIPTTLQLSSLVPFCIGTSTLILAMAGYALNEIFLFWFPNLLFSICLLIFIIAVNLISPSTSGGLQSLSVIAFTGSMLLLLIMGFFNWEKPVFDAQTTPHNALVNWRGPALLFWLFLAAELSVYHRGIHQERGSHTFSMMAAFVTVAVMFLLWGRTSLHFAFSERLLDTTVPHSVVARAISGESGRKIMGVAILTGSFASVNTLLVGVSAVLASMAKSERIFPVLKKKVLEGNAAMLFLSLGILFMLITGMAGKDITGTLTRSAFYLWLISHAALHVYTFRQLHQSGQKENKKLKWAGLLAAMVYLLGAIVLITTDPDLLMAIGLIVGFIVLSVLTVIFFEYNKKGK